MRRAEIMAGRRSSLVATAAQVRGLWKLARHLPDYLQTPVDRETAATAVRARLAEREPRFLATLARHLSARPTSSLARLLAWSGWTMADITAAVRHDGVEGTLAQLRDDGVCFSREELIGAVPLRRPGLNFTVHPDDFDDAGPSRALTGTTSGSRSSGIRVFYTWEFLAEEAADEAMLFAAHGLQGAPLAYWMPAMPALSGMHNLLIDLKRGQVPERWFAQVDAVAAGPPLVVRTATGAVLRLALAYVLWHGRRAASRTPIPEHTPLAQAGRVAAWLADSVRRRGTAVLKAYASAAVRVAAAARAAKVDLRGSVIFTGGEPLTAARRQFIEASGARVYARYVATESGLVAGACAARQHTDEMHLYRDRLAIVPADGDGSGLLVTTLSPHASKVLLNANLGDRATLVRRQCGCALGALGLDLLLYDVGSDAKLMSEGVKIHLSELQALVGPLIEAAGGTPDDCQFSEVDTPEGNRQLVIAVDPAVPHLDEAALVRQLLALLRHHPLRGNLTAQLWEQGESVRVIRQAPMLSRGHKLLSAAPPPAKAQ